MCLYVFSVCLHISKIAWSGFVKFSVHIPESWLGLPLTTLQYVMYFRFSGWHHVFR